ncbi:MAG: phosphoglycerate kinase [Candidatus Brocadia sp.]
MKKVCINELELRGKRVLIRVDFNVPLNPQGEVADDTRIKAALPTIRYALERGAKVLLISHLGRPKGRDPKLSLKPVALRLGQLLQRPVRMAEDCIGETVQAQVASMAEGDILMLENVRFHPEEERNDEAFAKALAFLCDVYVNDAFGTVHRAHASVDALPRLMPDKAAGFLLQKELTALGKLVEGPERPYLAVLGGAKVSDKIGVIEALLNKVDALLIGGGMANTFLKAQGFGVGRSLVEDSMLDVVKNLMDISRKNGIKLYLPVDFVVAENFDERAETKVVPFQEIPEKWIALDIGPASTKLFTEVLQDAKTIVWNGPMGAFEFDAFSRGTYAMVDAVTSSHASTIVGGGDTDMAFHKSGKTHEVTFISTGGGAFLKLLEGGELPGVASLSDRRRKARNTSPSPA